MKRQPVVFRIFIFSVCLLLMAGCAEKSSSTAAGSPKQLPSEETTDISVPEHVSEPVMTPVIVVPDDPGRTDDEYDTVSDDVPPEAAETSEEVPDDEDDNKAGIFTSSEITDELKSRINGKSYAEGCTIPYDDLRYLQLSYVDFNGETQTGEMICNKAIANDLIEIFSELYHNGYQIDKIRLIDDYNADDDASCDDDNTSCFNFRVVAGSTNLSKHAQGVAVDINPFYNPYVTYPNGKIRISPVGSEAYADRSSDFPHKIDENDLAYKLFTQHGFTWGGHWKTLKDYQHFQKPLK